MGFMSRLFTAPRRRDPSDIAYQKAMEISDDLITRMRDSTIAGDINRSLLTTLLAHRHNIPFLTSVYETVQEMDVPKANGLDTTH
jgi:hypothetical protein